ncbi:MAG: hypothetical protein QXQ11_06790 [Candidatus Bathyarchaeia archaeon]
MLRKLKDILKSRSKRSEPEDFAYHKEPEKAPDKDFNIENVELDAKSFQYPEDLFAQKTMQSMHQRPWVPPKLRLSPEEYAREHSVAVDWVKMWDKRAYELKYGKESWDRASVKPSMPAEFKLYEPEIKRYWNSEKAVGIMEFRGKYVGVACLAAKEVADKESYVRRFGLSFEKNVQWRGVSGLLDHLSRSSFFKQF